MPLHVDIRVNDTLINTLHIGRIEGGTDPDDVNVYSIVQGDRPTSISDWNMGVGYSHRYGDGAEICVMKGIRALKGFATGPVGKEIW